MRENRTSGSEGGEAQTNELSLPLSLCHPVCAALQGSPPQGTSHIQTVGASKCIFPSKSVQGIVDLALEPQ